MNCAFCNKYFEPKVWNAQCCSSKCNLKKWRKNNPERNRQIKIDWRRRNGILEKGSPEYRRAISKKMKGIVAIGNDHPLWKGNNVGYRALHRWVEGQLGKPDKCQNCLSDNLTGRQIHWSNVSHEYKREVDDWQRLCAKCHKAYDRKVQLCQ